MTHLLLVRHPPVSRTLAGRCYGSTDAALSREGLASVRGLVSALSVHRFAEVHTSPLRRARVPAARLAAVLGAPLHLEPRLAERHFGAWEGQTWDAIWAAEGDAMNGMIDAPASFRPGGGETTAEMADRVLNWFRTLSAHEPILAFTHGGPIAALVGSLLGETPRAWLRQVPAPGSGWEVKATATRWQITPWSCSNEDRYGGV